LLVESVKDYAIFMLDPAGLVVTWNIGAERIKGYSAEEILGRHFSCFYPPKDVQAGVPARALETAAAQGRSEDEGWRVRKDGSPFWAHVVLTALRDEAGTLVAFAKVTRDLTEQRRAAEVLRAGEEYALRIVDAAYDAFVSIDQEGVITGWNRHAQDMFGWSREEAIGRVLADTIIPTPQRDAHRRGMAHFLETGEGPVLNRVIELTALRRNGVEFPVELTISPLTVGRKYVFTAFVRDITQRREAEDKLKRYTADLEAANAELDTFSYSVSHDLRAPLRSIDGFSQALLEDYAAQLDDAGKQYLQRVRAGSQHMAMLIDDLLQLSRVTRAEMRRERVNLSELAHSIAADLKHSDPTRQVEFVITAGVEIDGDSRLFRLVLENLLGNAWKYTAKHPRARIEFGVTQREARPVYYVRDDGAGFDMTYADKLFGAFQRLHAPGEFEGTGVGLATVRRIIGRHGGRVWGEGAVEQGATFYFTV
jgi:PAS domain S-box-containing protein